MTTGSPLGKAAPVPTLLWTNERIEQVATDIIHPDDAYMAAAQNTVAYLLKLMRDEYEAELAKLRARVQELEAAKDNCETRARGVWDDFEIDDATKTEWERHGNTYQYMWVRELMRRIRDDTAANAQTRVGDLEFESKVLQKHVATLEAQQPTVGVLATIRAALHDFGWPLQTEHTYRRNHPKEVEALEDAWDWYYAVRDANK